MFRIIASAWALLLGAGMLMLGNGLQNSLLGIRASLEGFETTVTGVVMSGYYIGFLAGSTLTPKIVRNVGHVRVFSALASVASSAVLLHAVFVDPISWTLMRIVTGFCYAGIYVVAESWLNDRATNETRGQLLSIYMVVLLGDMALGQLLLNVAPPDGFILFLVASVLISLAMVPIALSAGPTPTFEAPSRVSPWQLYRLSPLGMVGATLVGMAHGTLFSMGAVYAERIGMTLTGVSLFMGLIIVGGVLFQWPIGRLSDRYDRRQVITVVTFLAGGLAFLTVMSQGSSQVLFLGCALLYGGMTLPLYSLCIAHANDYLEPSQIVAASGTLVLCGGVGAIFGPPLAANAMTQFGPSGFFFTLLAIHMVIGTFALYRMVRRESKPLDEQGPTLPMASGATAVTARLSSQAMRDQMDRDTASPSR